MIKMHSNQHISELVKIIKQHGIQHVIICPGSRNAPLIQLFYRDTHFICHSIVDERSAAYVALGMARQLNTPVVVLTTSGTAALNLAPAVAEAYYQKIPLVILTADRPAEWPSQFSNQMVQQEDMYIRNSKLSYGLPLEIASELELSEILTAVSGVIACAYIGDKGPVHLNIPLKEPLYETIPAKTNFVPEEPIPECVFSEEAISDSDLEEISGFFTSGKKVLIIAGVDNYSDIDISLLDSLSATFRVAVIAENITNLCAVSFIANPELVLGALNEEEMKKLDPDLVITMGGQVVSKRVRLFVQALECSVRSFDRMPLAMLSGAFAMKSESISNDYLELWKLMEKRSEILVEKYMRGAPFCNLNVIRQTLDRIPANATVHLGNSGTIRYSQLFPIRMDLHYTGNRGTSGIDGSLSSAVGAAMVSEGLHVVILGDLSFVYDSNAMWNREFPENLRIVVLDDAGGGIFKLIDGPDQMPFYEAFSVAHHPVKLSALAEAFNIKYLKLSDQRGLRTGLKGLFEKKDGPLLLIADTSESENSSIFKALFKTLKEQ